MTFKVVMVIVLSLNMLVFFMMMLDKGYAKKGKWRISESTLLSLGFFSGGFGMSLGMIAFKHKLNKARFFWVSFFGTCAYMGILFYLVISEKIIWV
jgi:uncharacterized membrane protein YsdA (DUF1294 family)